MFEVENVLLHALRAKRNAGRGTPAKHHQWGVAAMQLPVPFLGFIFKARCAHTVLFHAHFAKTRHRSTPSHLLR